MEPDHDPTPEYIESLKKVISKEITWEEHHHGARKQMLLALCRELKVDTDTITKIQDLEAQACMTNSVRQCSCCNESLALLCSNHCGKYICYDCAKNSKDDKPICPDCKEKENYESME